MPWLQFDPPCPYPRSRFMRAIAQTGNVRCEFKISLETVAAKRTRRIGVSLVRWNVSQFVRDPDSGKYKRRRRSEAEWVSHRDESLRIASDEVFEQVRARMRVCKNGDKAPEERR
jgi:ribosomal protein L32